MTKDEARALLRKPTVQRYNPGLGGLDSPVRKRHPSPALDGNVAAGSGRTAGVAVRVTIIEVSNRDRDGDNSVAGYKGLRDAITESLGFADDKDPRITWEYGQVPSRGEEGTIVKISYDTERLH